MAGSSAGRIQGSELSWTAGLSAHAEPAAHDATTAWETHENSAFSLSRFIKWSFLWKEGACLLKYYLICGGEKMGGFVLLRRTIDSVSLLQK